MKLRKDEQDVHHHGVDGVSVEELDARVPVASIKQSQFNAESYTKTHYFVRLYCYSPRYTAGLLNKLKGFSLIFLSIG